MNRCLVSVRTLAAAAGIVIAPAASAQNYEIWAMDQGTGTVHIFDASLNEVAKIDMSAHGVRVPHMIDFTPDYAYALIASTASGDVSVVRTADRKVMEVFKTGPATHAATVRPDGQQAIAAVIGDPKVERDGKLVEIVIDPQAGTFKLGRTLVIAEDPVFQQHSSRFKDVGAVCQQYTADGKLAYVTVGPAIGNGGLVVVDSERFALVAAYPPDELKVNCGTVRTVDGKHMFVNGGDHDVGHWYVLDAGTHKIVHQASSRGFDAHGVWPTPDGNEVWMVNRKTSNGIVIDAKTFAVLAEIADVGPTPDIVAMSPDSKFAFVTTRGPNPVSMPHIAKGTSPGLAVLGVPERKLLRLLEPAKGNEKSDFHGVGVRRLP